VTKRTWNKKYTKKKSSFQLTDEKIALLDREMRKTKLGESIANSTSGLYTVTGFEPGDPAVPEIPAVPAVPPTYENVTGGLSNTNDFVWPEDQGDGSDPDAAPNIPSNLYTTYNGEQVAALRQVDVDHGDGVVPLGLAFHGRAISSQVIGFITAGGFNAVVQSGVFTTPGPYTDLQQAYLTAWNARGTSGIFQYFTTRTVYFWGSLDCLFGFCFGGSQYFPSNLSNTSTPKADRALYSYELVIPTDASGNPLPNRFITDPGSPEIPAVPGVPEGPPRFVVLSRDKLGDPNYFPGVIKAGIDFIKNIGNALSEFGKGAEKAITQIGNKIREGEKALSNFTKPITTITDGIEDGINLLSNVKNILGSTQLGPKDSGGRYTLPPGSLGTQNNPLPNKVSSSTQEYLLKGYNPKIDGSLGQYLQRKTSMGLEQGGNIGAKGTHNNITGTPYIDNKGNIRIPDTYGFGPSEDIANKPIVRETVNFFAAVADALGGEKAKQEVSANVQTFFDQSGFGLIPGTPGKNAPIVHFETVIPASDAQKLAPNYKNQSVKEETLFEKFKRQNQPNQKETKISEYDLLIQEIQNLPGPIKKYLLLEFETSMKLATLSPDERQFKEKEIQNELLVKTSNLYIDTHFPENQKLFKKLQKSIKRNIKLTDPKTFKNVADTPSFKKLLSVDYVNKVDVPKKKLKLQNRNKKTAARFLKKPRIKSAMDLIDEKIIELEKDLKKTGIIP
jgi:hypothetical protein